MSRNFQVVSMCSSGNGGLAGQKALRARCSSTVEVLADRIEQHRLAELRRGLAEDVDALGLEQLQMRNERGHAAPSPRRRGFMCSPHSFRPRSPTTSGRRADVLAGLDRAGARLAADREEAARVQRIDRHVVGGDVGLSARVDQSAMRVDLDQAVRVIPGGERHLGATVDCSRRRPVIQPCGTCKRAVQRPHLAHLAAGLAVLDRLAEAEHAVAGDQRFDLAASGVHQRGCAGRSGSRLLERLERLGEQPAGIEGEDVDRRRRSAMACRIA